MNRIGLETHVEAFIYDPFPTVDRYRADDRLDTEILAEAKAKYKTDLIAISIYEVEVIELNGVVYRSEPLHRRRCVVDMDTIA